MATNFDDLVAKVKNLVALAPVLGAILRPALVILDADHAFKQQNALCLMKKSFIKVSMVRRSCLVIFYFEVKFCVLTRVGETCVTITAEDLVEKIISPVIFDRNRSFKW